MAHVQTLERSEHLSMNVIIFIEEKRVACVLKLGGGDDEGRQQGVGESRALASAAVGSHGIIAGTHFLVAGSARGNAVASPAASPARPLAHLLPRR